ncbi:peptidoglycan binding domain-containing protein, partial [Brevibacterium paucivorans]|uniref:peptidoglycan binding domain-containing protein n=1 Tax=Brevibacterium paucivorans TaxID=170994 RepID=UPI0015E0DE52
MGEKAQNASFEFSGGKLTVVPSKDGISAKDADVAKAVDAALKAENRTAELPLTAEKASFTTDDAKNMKMETMGKFSTP